MKLFASSQNASNNAIQNAGIELSEQELSAVSGGCGGSCGRHQETFFQDGEGEQGFHGGEENFSFGEGVGFWYPMPRHCHRPRRHCCRY